MKARTLTLSLTLLAWWAAPVAADDKQPVAPDTMAGGSIRLTGTFQVIWGDPPRDSDLPPRYDYLLRDEHGQRWKLLLDHDTLRTAGGLLALNGNTVVVQGSAVPRRQSTVVVETIALESGEAPDSPRGGVYGPQPYVWILLRFSDYSDTPEQPSWFETQAVGGHPSLDHFWRQLSFNNINLDGSTVVGWYNLPHPRSHYVYDIDPNDPGDELDAQGVLDDAVALADPDVNFNDFIGINLIFNAELDGWAWGGPGDVTADGLVDEWFGCTWMPPWGWREQGILGHEMGHALGLPHSSGSYGATYDSDWDVMSGSYGSCADEDPVYGCLGVHTISYHKNMLGWIHPLHRYEMPLTPTVTAVWLNDLVVVPPDGRLLMAKIPWPANPSRFYTFERRRWTGYDQNIPGEAVVIHSVDPPRLNPAWVVDGDGDGDCNDEGAMWELGETFDHNTLGIVATVEWADDTGSVITLSNAGRWTVYVNWANGGYEDGTSSYPWNTVWEGYGAVYEYGTVTIAPGSYPEALTLRKSATLTRWGSSGVVTIGQ